MVHGCSPLKSSPVARPWLLAALVAVLTEMAAGHYIVQGPPVFVFSCRCHHGGNAGLPDAPQAVSLGSWRLEAFIMAAAIHCMCVHCSGLPRGVQTFHARRACDAA